MSEMTDARVADWVLVPREPTPEILAAASIAVWPVASPSDVEMATRAADIVLRQSMDLAPGFTRELLAASIATMAPGYRAMLAAVPQPPAEARPVDDAEAPFQVFVKDGTWTGSLEEWRSRPQSPPLDINTPPSAPVDGLRAVMLADAWDYARGNLSWNALEARAARLPSAPVGVAADILRIVDTAIDVCNLRDRPAMAEDLEAVRLYVEQASAALAQQPAAAGGMCVWRENSDDGHWHGSCGAAWNLEGGGPSDNAMHYCPSCGRQVALAGQQGGDR